MKTLSIALILIMALAVTAQAGDAAVSIKGGLTIATFSGDGTEDLDSKSGFMIGGAAAFPMSPTFAIQPEIFYSQKGAKYTEENVEINVNLNYLDIPILAKYIFPGDKTRAFLLAGPSVGFKLSSSISTADNSADLDHVTGTDFGLVFGAGVNVEKFIFEARYNLGLSNVNDDPEDSASLTNTVWNILIGFGL